MTKIRRQSISIDGAEEFPNASFSEVYSGLTEGSHTVTAKWYDETDTEVFSETRNFTKVIAFDFLLDIYPGAKYAYSYRKLRAGYTGACIRVRRSSDNAEQDIPFLNNYIHKQNLLDFVGSGNGFIVKKYDQTVNLKDWIQTNAAIQIQIVTNGVISEIGGLVSTPSLPSLNKNLTVNISDAYLSTSTTNEYIVGLTQPTSGTFMVTSSDITSKWAFVGTKDSTSQTITAVEGSPILNIDGVDQAPTTRGNVFSLVATGTKKLITIRNADYRTWFGMDLDYSTTDFAGLNHTFEKIGYPDGTNLAEIQANINAYYTIY